MLRIASVNLVDRPSAVAPITKAAVTELNPHVVAVQNVILDANRNAPPDLADLFKDPYSQNFQGITKSDGTSFGNAVLSKLPIDANSFFEKLDAEKNAIDCLVTKTTFDRPESFFHLYNAMLRTTTMDQNALQDLGDFLSSAQPAIFTWDVSAAHNGIHDLLRLNGFVHLHPVILSGKSSTRDSDLAFWVTNDLLDKVNKIETTPGFSGTLLEINIK
jgi:hypothetical protein